MIADVPPPDDTPEEPLIEYGEYEECDDEPVDLTQLKTRRDGPVSYTHLRAHET